MKKTLVGSLVIISLSVLFFYDSVNYAINENTDKIESFIKLKTNQNIKIKNIHISFSSISIEKIKWTNKSMQIEFDNVEIEPDFSINTVFHINKIINNIKIENIDVKNNSAIVGQNNNFVYNNLSSYKKYIGYIPLIEIENIRYNKLNFSEISLKEEKNKIKIKSNVEYINNDLNVIGLIDLNKTLDNNKLNAIFDLLGKKIKLTEVNNFINLDNFKINNGLLDINNHFDIKDNNISMVGENYIKDLDFNIFKKSFKVDPLKIKTSIEKNSISANLGSQPRVNNITWDVTKIKFGLDENLNNFKNLTVSSSYLDYNGKFSESFNQNKLSKEINIKFNIVDLNFLHHLGIVDVPEPYNNTIIKNGTLNLGFYRLNEDMDYHLDYTVKGDAFLDQNNIRFKSLASLKSNKLLLNNFYINEKEQGGEINYDIDKNKLIMDLKLNVNQEIFNYIKNEYAIPFNINIFSNEIGLNFKSLLFENKWDYSGKIIFNNNDLSAEYRDKPITFKNTTGEIGFSTHHLDDFNVQSENISQGEYKIENISVLCVNKEESINAVLNSDIFNAHVLYDKNKDSLDIKIPKFDYDFKTNEKWKVVIKENEKDIERIKKLDFPKDVSLEIDDLNLNDIELGKLTSKSLRKENNKYILNSVLNNTGDIAKIDTELDLENLTVENNISLSVKSIEDFDKRFKLNKKIKDGNLVAQGKFKTNLTSLDLNSLIENTNGTANFLSEKGEFSEVTTGPGFLLSLFSFQTLPNIMTFKLKDVFSNKFNYENIKGDLSLNGFEVKVDKLNINSPISQVNLTGNIDLKEEKLKLDLHVVPKVTNSIVFTTISLASSLNPLTFLGGAILEKIIPLPEFIEYDYSVKGTFDKPILEKK